MVAQGDRELDAWLAKHLTGWSRDGVTFSGSHEGMNIVLSAMAGSVRQPFHLHRFSDKTVREDRPVFARDWPYIWRARFGRYTTGRQHWSYAKTAPMAVALAAQNALEAQR